MRDGAVSAITVADSPRILVVDDEDALRRVFARALQAAGFEVVEACDGREAITAFTDRVFDVVLSDVSMPNLNGLELLRAVRERDAAMPVLLVTAMPTPEGASKARELGAFDYLSKPLSLRELIERARAAVSGRDTKRDPEQGPPGAPSSG